MNTISAYIKIIRPVNAFLAMIGVTLGFWLCEVDAPLTDLILLIIAATAALGFGNVINDIKDAEGDTVNHPERPIPTGVISSKAALVFAMLLAVISLFSSRTVSLNHGIATLIPLLLLILYTLFLKGVPLIGNIIISLLVAYTLIFGGLGSANVAIIVVPAFLAFLLNLSREIIKDIQDKEGDLRVGVTTTAIFSEKILKTVIIFIGLLYITSIFIPYLLGHFGFMYFIICVGALLPLHLFWFFRLMGKNTSKKLGRISTAIKLEMLGGLLALAIDKILII